MKQCTSCKGSTESRRIEHVHRWKGDLYILRNVAAEVCAQCGEVFFEPSVLAAMDEVVMRKEGAEKHRSVPVYSL